MYLYKKPNYYLLIIISISFVTNYRFFENSDSISFLFVELILLSVLFVFISKIFLLKKQEFLLSSPHIPSNHLVIFSIMASLMLFNLFFLQNIDFTHRLSIIKELVEGMILYTLIFLIDIKKEDVRKILLSFIGFAFFASIFAIIQINTGEFRFFEAESSKWKTGYSLMDLNSVLDLPTALGLFNHPNNFGYYLAVAFILAVFLIKNKPLRIIVISIILFTLFNTFARNALLSSLIVITVTYFLFNRLRKNEKVIILVVLLLSFITLLSLVFTQNLTGLTLNMSWRFIQWQETLAMISSHPSVLLFGGGTFFMETESFFRYPYPHNLLLYAIIDYGVLNTTLLLLVLITTLKNLLKNNSSESKALFASLFVIFLFGLTDDYLVQHQHILLSFFFLGLANKIILLRNMNDEE